MVEPLNPAGLPPVGGPGQPGASRPARVTSQAEGAPSFAEILQQQLLTTAEGVKFSAHAQDRLRMRSIDLSPSDLARIDEGVRRAASKGSQESLLLSDKAAFVVSIRNRTVITVVDSAHMKENVFTNIDSAVIL